MLKVLHLIPSLGSGGAEAMLTKLVSNNKDSNITMVIVTLLNINYFSEEITRNGIKIYCLNLKSKPLGFLNMFKIIKSEKPDIIQTWMYHCDFLGLLIKAAFPKVKLFWNIRHSFLVEGVDKRTTIVLAHILGKISFIPNKIIFGSAAAFNFHTGIGYKKNSAKIIPNGFDTELFSPSDNEKNTIRKELSVPPKNLIFGHVGREKRIKNQIMLIEAFTEVIKYYPSITLILIGKGLKEKYSTHPLVISGDIRILDETQTIHRYLKSFDLFILPSLSEGFPNVIGEAMATGVPCISTNVGDSAKIIGKDELIAWENSRDDLTMRMKYWLQLNEREKNDLKSYSRNRIKENFSIGKIVSQYQQIYKKSVK